MIPKIIHYCWFGGAEKPEILKKCMASWKLLTEDGYKLMCWDESNCTFDENDYIRLAYKVKKYAFMSDYYRLQALYKWGGYISIQMS